MLITTYRAHSSTNHIERWAVYKDAGATAGTEGDPFTTLAFGDSGLIVSVSANNAATVTDVFTAAAGTIETVTTLGSYSAPTATKCRLRLFDATNHPGLIEVQFANAIYATAGAKYLDVSIHGVTDLAVLSVRIYLDVLDAAGIRTTLGMAAATYDTDIANIPTVAEMNARTIVAANYALDSTVTGITESLDDYESGVTNIQVKTVTFDGSASADVALIDTNVDAILVDTSATIPATLAGLATSADLAIVDTNVDAILVDTSASIPGLIAALNDPAVSDILTTQMTESYATLASAPTLAQALFMIQQHLTEFAISGTTITTKKLDGAATAGTFTLDDGTNPTSLTRAT